MKHDFHAASDGQLGGIMKMFRDWQISGDSEWLKKMYPLAKKSLDYCIRTWDPDAREGGLQPHHNTYDIEFWGPDGTCTSIFWAPCPHLVSGRSHRPGGRREALQRSGERCAQFMDQHLFNREYYEQKVQYDGLRDHSFADMVAKVDDQSSEMQRLLKHEGPKYQYGSGCLSDGVIGIWMARTYGIDVPISREHVRRALRSIFDNNFKTDLAEHANRSVPATRWDTNPACCCARGPRVEGRRCHSFIPMKCGRALISGRSTFDFRRPGSAGAPHCLDDCEPLRYQAFGNQMCCDLILNARPHFIGINEWQRRPSTLWATCTTASRVRVPSRSRDAAHSHARRDQS